MGLMNCGGCLLTRLGITRLSQLEIDTDKNWGTMGISNLLELAASMTKGDMLVRSDDIIVKISPGSAGTKLTTQGSGALPEWKV